MPAKKDEPEPLALKLKPKEEDRLLRGHKWVFSNELESLPKGAEPGALAVARTSKDKVLGLGFFNPASLIAFRMLSRSPLRVDKQFFLKRLGTALSMRRSLYPGEESFRLCFGESDNLPGLVVDKYEEFLIVQVLSAGMERRLDLIRDALVELLEPKGIFLKNDNPTRSLEGLPLERRTLHGEVPERIRFREGELEYFVTPEQCQKTGFYFDQRENRAALAPCFKNRTVLDLYCYTGAFALTAAKHGAAKVLALDCSEPAVVLAREHARLNGLLEKCEFDEGDADEVLSAFARFKQNLQPDLIILDPPSLVPARKHLPKALRAYARINANALKALPRGGLLATSTCSHHVSREEFVRMLRAAGAKAEKQVRLVELRGQAKDHPVLLSMPETEYLHFALLEVTA